MTDSHRIEWLIGSLDGYGIVTREDGSIDVYRASGRCIGSAGNWECAVALMTGDE